MTTIAIVIPAYNEGSAIGEVIASIPKVISGFDSVIPIVVDDGSADNTSAIARSKGATVVRHRFNIGAGGATYTGMRAARKLGADCLVTLDADGQHDPSEMNNLLQPILSDQGDFVIGSRLMDPKGMPTIKRLTNKFANFITYLFAGLWVTDSQSGFKAFSSRALQEMRLTTFGYEFCTEMISEAKTKGLRVVEVPIKAIYTDYSARKGQSLANGVNVIWRLVVNRVLPGR